MDVPLPSLSLFGAGSIAVAYKCDASIRTALFELGVKLIIQVEQSEQVASNLSCSLTLNPVHPVPLEYRQRLESLLILPDYGSWRVTTARHYQPNPFCLFDPLELAQKIADQTNSCPS